MGASLARDAADGLRLGVGSFRSTLGRMTASDAVRTVVYVTHPEGQTLTALRQARVSRDMLQRRLIPVALLPLGLTVALQVEKSPAPG